MATKYVNQIKIVKDADNYILSTKKINETISSLQGKYNFKGIVNNFESLPAENNTINDVYKLKDTDEEYVWEGTEWILFEGYYSGEASSEGASLATDEEWEAGISTEKAPSVSQVYNDLSIEVEDLVKLELSELSNYGTPYVDNYAVQSSSNYNPSYNATLNFDTAIPYWKTGSTADAYYYMYFNQLVTINNISYRNIDINHGFSTCDIQVTRDKENWITEIAGFINPIKGTDSSNTATIDCSSIVESFYGIRLYFKGSLPHGHGLSRISPEVYVKGMVRKKIKDEMKVTYEANVSWSDILNPPILTANGTPYEDEYAVSASSEYDNTTYAAYKAAGDFESIIAYWAAAVTSGTQYLYMYFKDKVTLTKLDMRKGSNNQLLTYAIEMKSDDDSWVEIVPVRDVSSIDLNQTWEVDLTSIENYSNTFRIVCLTYGSYGMIGKIKPYYKKKEFTTVNSTVKDLSLKNYNDIQNLDNNIEIELNITPEDAENGLNLLNNCIYTIDSDNPITNISITSATGSGIIIFTSGGLLEFTLPENGNWVGGIPTFTSNKTYVVVYFRNRFYSDEGV